VGFVGFFFAWSILENSYTHRALFTELQKKNWIKQQLWFRGPSRVLIKRLMKVEVQEQGLALSMA